MTSVSTGPLPASSLRPSCSWIAVKIDGGPVGSEAGSSENFSTRISNRPVIPVLSITGRCTTIRSVLENSSTVAPLASTEDDIPPLIVLPQYFLPGWSGGGGTDQGVQLPSVNGCNFGPPRTTLKK